MAENLEMRHCKEGSAIEIRNAYKRYSSKVVLNDFNLTVPKGCIYGLLGPSSCGKTTVLNCIVGMSQLDSGYIKINVDKRSDIGFMPQAISLQYSMSITETFFFYGYLLGMNDTQILARSQEYISLLQIPSGDRLVKAMSGGQQRRLSLSVALFHDPQMLILDEPTVGLDPILSSCIWEHLLVLASLGKSIILTTHYIQEAQKAHVIGLLREGVLLAEESPQSLMVRYACDGLEQAFLKLSERQEQLNDTSQESKQKWNKFERPFTMTYADDGKIFSKSSFKGMVYKNMVMFSKEIILILFMTVLPSIQIFIFNTAVGRNPEDLRIAVVNEETWSCHPTPINHSCFLNKNDSVSLSCWYMDFMKSKSYEMVRYNNSDEAMHVLATNRKTWAFIHIHQGFTDSQARKLEKAWAATEEDFAASFIEARLDGSNQYIASLITSDLLYSIVAVMRKALTNCDLNPSLGSQSIVFNKPIYGSNDEEFITYASIVMVCVTVFFFPSLSTAMYVFTERTGGTIQRILVAGASIVEILSSTIVFQFGIFIMQATLVMIIMYEVFDNPLIGSILLYIILLILTGMCGILLGLVLAMLIDQAFLMGLVAIGINATMCLTLGLLWPIEGANKFIQIVNWFTPISDTIKAVRGISIKNYNFNHPTVRGGFMSGILWNFIFLLILYVINKWNKNTFQASQKEVH